MEKTGKKTCKFGLVGRNISYSFSQGYFTEKFKKENLPTHEYVNFDLEKIDLFRDVIKQNIKGCNVTIPYKQAIIPYIDTLDSVAQKIGAVNTIKFTKNGTIGYNTDAYGFEQAICPFLKEHHKKALILGTGGASKAVAYVLEKLGITYTYVSRSANHNQYNYQQLSKEIIENNLLIINCSPVGTFPNIEDKPNLPYQFINNNHLFFDLIYNPTKTQFLKEAEIKGAAICNGLTMLEQQAEKAWSIWNS